MNVAVKCCHSTGGRLSNEGPSTNASIKATSLKLGKDFPEDTVSLTHPGLWQE